MRVIASVGLVNLIMDAPVIEELIQADCTPRTITAELELIANDKNYRSRMLDNYDKLDERMGTPGASAKTAALIVKYNAKK